jgi:hypothetical protein
MVSCVCHSKMPDATPRKLCEASAPENIVVARVENHKTCQDNQDAHPPCDCRALSRRNLGLKGFSWLVLLQWKAGRQVENTTLTTNKL